MVNPFYLYEGPEEVITSVHCAAHRCIESKEFIRCLAST